MNVFGEGPLSTVLAVTPAAIPNAPTFITQVNATSSEITFSWTEPYNGGIQILRYNIYWDQGSGTPNYVASSPVSVTYPTTVYTKSTGL